MKTWGIIAVLIGLMGGHASSAQANVELTGTLAVVNKATNSLSVIDIASATMLAEMPTGKGPHEAVIANDGCRVVVSDYVGGNSLSVFDICELRPLRTIDLAAYPRPHGMVFVGATDEVIVTSGPSQKIVRIDIGTGRIVGSIDTTYGSHMVALAGSTGYSTNGAADRVTAFTLDSDRARAQHAVGPRPEAIAVTADGREVWVGSNAAGTVSILDPQTGDLRVVADGFRWPYRIVFTPDEARVLVPDLRGGQLRIMPRSGDGPVSMIDLPDAVPQGLVVHPSGRYAFQSLNLEDRIAIVDLEAARVVDYLPAGSRPDGIVYSAFRHPVGTAQTKTPSATTK